MEWKMEDGIIIFSDFLFSLAKKIMRPRNSKNCATIDARKRTRKKQHAETHTKQSKRSRESS